MPEVFSRQTSLAKWLQLYPNSLIMQPDPSFIKAYDSSFKFESGKSKSRLTGTDSLSWNEKSWVVGITIGKESKAYDWNQLRAERIINDRVNTMPIVLVLADDDKSFFAFERPDTSKFILSGDTLINANKKYRIDGMAFNANSSLKPLPAYQEFWHSWMTFHSNTGKY